MNDSTNEPKAQHTPGPWAIGQGEQPPSYLIKAEKSLIALLPYTYRKQDEQAANARLIASAPELLEALREVEKAIRSGDLVWKHKRQLDSDPYHPATIKMTAAIAKATA